MSKIKSISERVSYANHDGYTTVVISTKIDRWKESLMLFWLLAWSFCGVYFMYELFWGNHANDMKITLIIMLGFWLYFEVRIGKAFMWRKHGMEFLKIEEDELTYKRSIKGYGKALRFFNNNIKNIALVDRKETHPLSFLENSSWFIGGETIEFKHMGKAIRLGLQLEEKEAKKLVEFLKKNLK